MYEGAGSVTICLTLTISTECLLLANISTSESSATGMSQKSLLTVALANVSISQLEWTLE